MKRGERKPFVPPPSTRAPDKAPTGEDTSRHQGKRSPLPRRPPPRAGRGAQGDVGAARQGPQDQPAPLLAVWGLLLLQRPLVLLGNAVRDVGSHGAQLLGSLHMEHLVVEEDVRPDLLQQRPLGSPGQEQSLIRLQAPTAQSL